MQYKDAMSRLLVAVSILLAVPAFAFMEKPFTIHHTLPTRMDQLPVVDNVADLEVFRLKEGRNHRLYQSGFQAYVNDETARRVETGLASFPDLIAEKVSPDDLSTVATLGSYDALDGKSEINISRLAEKADSVTYETLAALAEGDTEDEKVALKTLFEPGGWMPFDTTTVVDAVSVPAAVKSLQTQSGDQFRRVDAEPSHPSKIRSLDRFTDESEFDEANGGWWELVDPYPRSFWSRAELIAHLAVSPAVAGREYRARGVSWVGAPGTTVIPDLPDLLPVSPVHPEHFKENTTPGVTEMADAVQLALDAGYSVQGVPGVAYKFSSMMRITTDGTAIDFRSSRIDATDFRDSGSSLLDDRTDGLFDVLGELKLQTTLVASIGPNSVTATLDDVTGIQPGDVVMVRSASEHWYTSSGAPLAKEMVNRVLKIDGSVVTFESPFALSLDTGLSAVDVYVWTGVLDVSIAAGDVIGPGFVENRANGWGESFVSGFHTQNLKVEVGYVVGFQGYVIRSARFWNTNVKVRKMQGWPDGFNPSLVEDQNSGFYGAFFVQGNTGMLSDSYGTRLRHMVDGASAWNIIVKSNKADGGWRAPFTSHERSSDWLFEGNIGRGTGNAALLWRGFNLKLANNDLDATGRAGSYGFQDASGAANDMGRTYVFNGDTLKATRSAILVEAKIGRMKVISAELVGGYEIGYHPFTIQTRWFDYISFNGGTIETATTASCAVVQDASPNSVDRKLVKFKDIFFKGYSASAFYANHSTRPNVTIAEDNVLDPVGSPTNHINVPAANLRLRGRNVLINGTTYNPD